MGKAGSLQADVAGEDEDEMNQAVNLAEAIVDGLQVWSLYAEEATLADDWSHRQAAFGALAALLEDSDGEDKSSNMEARGHQLTHTQRCLVRGLGPRA